VCIFGISSWVAVNGVWTELPVLMITQPECYKLAAVLSVVAQIANVGPIIYTIVKLIYHYFHFKLIYLEFSAVFTLITIGVISSILLSFFWANVSLIGQQSHSVLMIVLVFFLALVDCTSSVVYIPFMKHLPSVYLTALFIGEGLSGVIPSLFAVIQGPVNVSVTCTDGVGINDYDTLNIRYSPHMFFLFLAVIILLSGLAFIGLLVLPCSRREMQRQELLNNTKVTIANNENEDHTKFIDIQDSSHFHMITSGLRRCVNILYNQRTPLFCTFWLSFFTNGALMSIFSFAFGYYGNTILHWGTILGILINPVGALMYGFLPIKSRMISAVNTAVVLILSQYVIVISMINDKPGIFGIGGGIFLIIVYVLLKGLSCYTKVGITNILHSDPCSSDTALFLNGISTQTGSLVGSVLFFVLVYYSNLYT
jgi:riboflavin transporter 2